METLTTQEKMEQTGTEIYFVRHSKANYDADFEQARSENPTSPIDRKNQPKPDLTKEGTELAQEEARKLYTKFPKGTSVTFLSSDLQRASETAQIYREEAEMSGMNIVEISKFGEAIRSLKSLSLREYNPLSLDVFNPYVKKEDIDAYKWDNTDSQYKQQWKEAFEYVRSKGIKSTWGENFYAYSEEIKNKFPLLEIEDRQTLFKKQFVPLMRMAHWALKRFQKEDVKILCFGHEDYVSKIYELKAQAEDKEYKGLANCEYFRIGLNKEKDLEITTQ